MFVHLDLDHPSVTNFNDPKLGPCDLREQIVGSLTCMQTVVDVALECMRDDAFGTHTRLFQLLFGVPDSREARQKFEGKNPDTVTIRW
jgi:hypothetical protein